MQANQLPSLPLVGRGDELRSLHAALEQLGRGRGGFWLVAGESGAGKTRLGKALLEEAGRQGLGVARGRAYPVEVGAPYALFADALVPVIRRMGADSLTALTRGVGELAQLFPWLLPEEPWQPRAPGPEFRGQLHWHFAQFLQRMAEKQPSVVLLDDVHWADASSLELLHFVARQLADAPLLVYCTLNTDYEKPPALAALEQSLTATGMLTSVRLRPLSRDDVAELVRRVFGASPGLVGGFAAHLYAWTRGNPFFIEETLKALVASGELRCDDGHWTGWETERLVLPTTVREAVLSRLSGLRPEARRAADLAAVVGSRVRLSTLAALLGVPTAEALDTVEELCRWRVLEEVADDGDGAVLDFTHPLLREAVYGELGRLRRGMLHSLVATTLEATYGDAALEHAHVLAYHYERAEVRDAGRAVVYLRHAGAQALRQHANREAADYLAAALQRMGGVADADEQVDAMELLARARQRLGEYDEALRLWERVQHHARERNDPERAADVERRAGLAFVWSGRHAEALQRFDRAQEWADAAGDAASRVRVGIARASCLQELGRVDEALAAADAALAAAAAVPAAAQPALLGRVHRTMLQIHLWRGEAHGAREHGGHALQLARRSGDRVLEFTAHWAAGVLECFSGNAAGVQHHVAEATRLADELRSPVLRAWAAELVVEYAAARGDWDEAVAAGEEAIRLARALQQQGLLARLLVWTGLIHCARGDHDRGDAYVEEAWRLAGAGSNGAANVHALLPAYIGRAAARLARGDYSGAISIGQEGLAVADRLGESLWSVHRLLPTIAEAQLWLRQIDGAVVTGERLRRDSERLGHRIGMAWASSCDAIVAWLAGDTARGAVLLREAAEQLEALPFMYDATRVRRQLAGRLADLGDRAGALRELRLVHERLVRLGAEGELQKARNQFRELGIRPPPLGTPRTTGPLTTREAAIAERIARNMSSKAVARDLQVSVRTVDAHLANIYRKLGIHSRTELAELHRQGALSA
jgi:DNA-binding NarL/FixJ family response regulator